MTAVNKKLTRNLKSHRINANLQCPKKITPNKLYSIWIYKDKSEPQTKWRELFTIYRDEVYPRLTSAIFTTKAEIADSYKTRLFDMPTDEPSKKAKTPLKEEQKNHCYSHWQKRTQLSLSPHCLPREKQKQETEQIKHSKRNKFSHRTTSHFWSVSPLDITTRFAQSRTCWEHKQAWQLTLKNFKSFNHTNSYNGEGEPIHPMQIQTL